ncbi:MAG: helix-turn-helix domain-containing protein [Aggregatilineales bacterium]
MPPAAAEQLAYLGFRTVAPGQHLRPYVSEYWYFQRETPLATYQDEYMHPTGGYGIAFNFGDDLRLDGVPLNAPVFLDGANTVSRKLGFMGRVDLFGIRFHEGGAYPFLGIPLVELQNAFTLLEALSRARLLQLHGQLYDAKSLMRRIQLIENWLLMRLSEGKTRHAVIPESLLRLREDWAHLSIPDLANELAISQRQLERLYQYQVGMSPKQYARLHRVESARLALKNMPDQSATRLALELGFYDQAHFIREFSAVVGMTPYAYMKRKRETESTL